MMSEPLTKIDQMEARVFEAWPLVPSYSPAVGTPRDSGLPKFLWLSPLHQPPKLVPGHMLAAQGHIASPRLKPSHGISVAQVSTHKAGSNGPSAKVRVD